MPLVPGQYPAIAFFIGTLPPAVTAIVTASSVMGPHARRGRDSPLMPMSGRGDERSSVRTCPTVVSVAVHWTLGCDAHDPTRLAEFWATALGYMAEPGYDDPDGASIVDPEGKGPAIGWLRVPEGKSAKNRVHIDIRVAGEGPWDMPARERLIRAKVPELVALGASIVREERYGEDLGH